MNNVVYVEDDLVNVTRVRDGKRFTLAWGDPVQIPGPGDGEKQVRVLGRGARTFVATYRGTLRTRPEGILRLSMVDVQQGDGMILETPKGRRIFIDGGESRLFARHAAARFRNTSPSDPAEVDALVVSHGDADHFRGLTEIRKSEVHEKERKRLFLAPRRVYHNGLVKGSSKLPADRIFGRTVDTGEGKAVVDLEDDLRGVAQDRMNRPFRNWVEALKHWSERGPLDMRRLSFGDAEAFRFLADEEIRVRVLGPIPQEVSLDGRLRPALPLLHAQPKEFDPVGDDRRRRYSAKHTINGHSIVLKIEFGNVRILLTGDLNRESMRLLRGKVQDGELEAEVVKVPHHGSSDFDLAALKAMAPVVWLVSSGDESARTEHIHPRATLMGALGRASRGDTSLVFCTELVAFFARRGPSIVRRTRKSYYGFERTSWGIVHVRTDGRRVLVFTHSGRENMKEAYRFRVDGEHRVRFESVRKH